MTTTCRNHPITEVFPVLSDSDYQTLKKDIEVNGLLEPIWRDDKGRIIDGRHRYRACKELKIDPEFQETAYSDEEIPDIVLSLNLRRRHLTESQRSVVAAKMLPFYEKAAKARQLAGLKQGDQDPVKENLPEREKGSSSDKAGAKVGVSGRSVRDAKKVFEEGCEELQDALEQDKVKVSDAAKAAKETKTTQRQALKRLTSGKAKTLKEALTQMMREKQVKEIEALDPATGGYPVVVVDPPWPYEARKNDPTQRGKTPYPQMPVPDICKVQIPSADDSILFLWVTNSHLANGNAARVCTAWGYQPKTIYTWVKNRMGTGDWGRSQTEHVVLGVRGKPKLKEVPPTVFEANVGEHSEKPEEFYKLVEKITVGSKAELFSREQREGWFCFGHEEKPQKAKAKTKAKAKRQAVTPSEEVEQEKEEQGAA
jgi:N6-adenosine-specific RNA methylase IME4